jgi:hypothetical protein
MTPKTLQLSVKACFVSILASLIGGAVLGANGASLKRAEPWHEGYDQCVADYERKFLQIQQDRLTRKHFAPYESPANPILLPRPR